MGNDNIKRNRIFERKVLRKIYKKYQTKILSQNYRLTVYELYKREHLIKFFRGTILEWVAMYISV